MAGEATSGRPQLKGAHLAAMKKNLYVAIGLSILSGIAYKLAIADPRKRAYAEFYKTYDAEASFKRMALAGLLTSAGPEDYK